MILKWYTMSSQVFKGYREKYCALVREGGCESCSERVSVILDHIGHSLTSIFYGFNSLDEQKAQSVVDEIIADGGDAIAICGDVGAEWFPDKIVKATIE
jgi:hypothetical protein